MKINKKIVLGLGTVSTIVAPIAAVVSCGSENTTTSLYAEYLKQNSGHEVKIYGFKKELAKELGYANHKNSDGDYETILQEKLKNKTVTLFNIASDEEAIKFKDDILDMTKVSINDGEELFKLRKNIAELAKHNAKTQGNKMVPAFSESFGLIANEDKLIKDGIKITKTEGSNTNGFNTKNELFYQDINEQGVELLIDALMKTNKDKVMAYPAKKGSEWPFFSHLLGAAKGYFNKFESAKTEDEKIKSTINKTLELLDHFILASGGGKKVSERSVDDQVKAFANGEIDFIQQGSWEEATIKKINPNIKLILLPLVFGMHNQKAHSVVITSQWWAINKNSTKQEKENAARFLNWTYFGNGRKKLGSIGVNAPSLKGIKINNSIESHSNIYNLYESATPDLPKAFNITDDNKVLMDALRTYVLSEHKVGDKNTFKGLLTTAFNS